MSTPPKYRLTETTGRNSFRMYSAGPGQTGQGRLVFHDTWVEVVLNPDSAWRTATKAKRKDSNKLKLPDGTWNIWFLFSRAFVLSLDSIAESGREMGPATTQNEALNHLRSAGKAHSIAAEARRHAGLEALMAGEELPLEIFASDWAYIEWFEQKRAEFRQAEDGELTESVDGFVRAADALRPGYPLDVLLFSRALREEAVIAGGPPTKEQVRLSFGRELQRAQSAADLVKPSGDGKVIRSGKGSAEPDIVDPNTFTRLLKRAGFDWLPNGKPGPRRHTKAGR